MTKYREIQEKICQSLNYGSCRTAREIFYSNMDIRNFLQLAKSYRLKEYYLATRGPGNQASHCSKKCLLIYTPGGNLQG